MEEFIQSEMNLPMSGTHLQIHQEQTQTQNLTTPFSQTTVHSLFPSDSSLSVSPLYTVRTKHLLPTQQLVSTIKDLNSKKAPGPDHISNNMISTSYAYDYSASSNHSQIPFVWILPTSWRIPSRTHLFNISHLKIYEKSSTCISPLPRTQRSNSPFSAWFQKQQSSISALKKSSLT
ncbi:hypothetical protein DERF_009163 [Dermatophagoides farinae]|uniref:Uncharacterized protein n=1 Tax=Dermatophagoides farinae TaxID=6954 RepID=A0A922HYJ6_DERFA|nr:hypothetical protein DERF_009163 [Dermatophagoides farinae]